MRELYRIALSLLGLVAWAGCDRGREPPGAGAGGLIMVPASVDLGTLRPGQASNAAARLMNTGSEALGVEKIQTSCPCVSVSPGSLWIGLGETVELVITFDPKAEPDFRGKLAVEVNGKDRDGSNLFRGVVTVGVASEPPSS